MREGIIPLGTISVTSCLEKKDNLGFTEDRLLHYKIVALPFEYPWYRACYLEYI